MVSLFFAGNVLSNSFTRWGKSNSLKVKLTPEMLTKVKDAFNERKNKVFFSGTTFNVTRNDLLTLKGSTWVNDEVMNCRFKMIASRNAKEKYLPDVHVMTTFFYR